MSNLALSQADVSQSGTESASASIVRFIATPDTVTVDAPAHSGPMALVHDATSEQSPEILSDFGVSHQEMDPDEPEGYARSHVTTRAQLRQIDVVGIQGSSSYFQRSEDT